MSFISSSSSFQSLSIFKPFAGWRIDVLMAKSEDLVAHGGDFLEGIMAGGHLLASCSGVNGSEGIFKARRKLSEYA